MLRKLIRTCWRALLVDRNGGVMVEFAIAIPVLITLLLGGIEVGRLVLLHQKLDRVAMTVSDLVSRVQVITTEDVDTVFIAANLVMEPFHFGDRGVVIISSVKEEDNLPKVIWQRIGAGDLPIASQIGNQGDNATLKDPELVTAEQGVIVGEAFYHYSPWFIDLIPAITLRQVAIFRPRLVNEVTCSNC